MGNLSLSNPAPRSHHRKVRPPAVRVPARARDPGIPNVIAGPVRVCHRLHGAHGAGRLDVPVRQTLGAGVQRALERVRDERRVILIALVIHETRDVARRGRGDPYAVLETLVELFRGVRRRPLEVLTQVKGDGPRAGDGLEGAHAVTGGASGDEQRVRAARYREQFREGQGGRTAAHEVHPLLPTPPEKREPTVENRDSRVGEAQLGCGSCAELVLAPLVKPREARGAPRGDQASPAQGPEEVVGACPEQVYECVESVERVSLEPVASEEGSHRTFETSLVQQRLVPVRLSARV